MSSIRDNTKRRMPNLFVFVVVFVFPTSTHSSSCTRPMTSVNRIRVGKSKCNPGSHIRHHRLHCSINTPPTMEQQLKTILSIQVYTEQTETNEHITDVVRQLNSCLKIEIQPWILHWPPEAALLDQCTCSDGAVSKQTFSSMQRATIIRWEPGNLGTWEPGNLGRVTCVC